MLQLFSKLNYFRKNKYISQTGVNWDKWFIVLEVFNKANLNYVKNFLDYAKKINFVKQCTVLFEVTFKIYLIANSNITIIPKTLFVLDINLY